MNPNDPWLNYLSVVGATFWRGFPYDIFFFALLVWSLGRSQGRIHLVMAIITIFMGALIAINLAIGTLPAWLKLTTF